MARYTGRTCRLVVMLILNLLCFLMEISFGFLSNSMVLTADAFNVLSDFLGVVITLVCIKIAAKGPSEKNTYGWTRCDVLGALINAVFMLALCVTIILDSCQRFIQPEEVDKPQVVFYVGIAGLAVNVVGIVLLKEYRSASKKDEEINMSHVEPEKLPHQESSVSVSSSGGAKKGGSSHMNMHGAYLHILGDALGSVIVIICAVIDWQTDVWFLELYLDPILSILMAIMLAFPSLSLLKESSLTLLQAVPTTVNLKNIKSNIFEKSRHILEVNNLHVWQLSSEKLVASVRVRFDNALAYEKMAQLVAEIEQCFHEEGIFAVTVHPVLDFDGENDTVVINGIEYVSRRNRCGTCFKDEKLPALATIESESELTPTIKEKPIDIHAWI